MLKAVIFDFDGVIVDSEPLHYEAFARVVRPLGIEVTYEQYLDRYVGFDDRDLIRVCIADHTHLAKGVHPLTHERLAQFIESKAQAFEQIVSEGINTIPGVVKLIDEVSSHMPVAIASGASRRDIDLVLRRLSLAAKFQVIVSADDVARSKPDPETYAKATRLLAARHPSLELQPRQCLAIEDTAAGLQAARSAGLMTLGLTTTTQGDALHLAQRVVSDLSPLSLATLRQWYEDAAPPLARATPDRHVH